MAKKYFPGNDGARGLLEWMLGPPRRTQAALAKKLNVSQQTVSGWVNGVVPGALFRMLIEKRVGVPFSVWPSDVDQVGHDSESDQGAA